jgi:hypothetical protein
MAIFEIQHVGIAALFNPPIIDLFTLSWILLMCRLPLALHMRFHLHVFGIVKSNAINWLFGLHELGQWASSCPSLAAAHYPFFLVLLLS